ncbi:MAG: A/G-specific adenine glycosylase, partial [Alphaproteobacteria bacterium]|nr:A/G-specific adenine glycosylase [Alphaproteobacteria bacterium]
RAPPGGRADPYAVWLSEIMLQQTTVAAVGPYFARFLARWPDVAALARATLDEVLVEWQGLGYYARARNLHRAARVVAEEQGGVFPSEEAALRALPGIGAYTAAAIAAIAFDRPAAAVDGNVERVLARLYKIETPLPRAKRDLAAIALALVPDARPGDYAQALMDLGATVCTPRAPSCVLCPFARTCRARRAGIEEELPRRAARKARPLHRAIAFWAERADGQVLLRRRPESGLLGCMIEVPSTEWRPGPWSEAAARREAPMPARWAVLGGTVAHGFTHLDLDIRVMTARLPKDAPAPKGTFWWPLDRLEEQALPTLTKKICAHAQGRRTGGRRAR